MLKLKNISPHIRKIYNESDYYVKIRILFQQIDPSTGVCYWNVYGQENSFTEFSLHNPTGAIYDLTVLCMDSSIQHKNIPIVLSNIPEQIGFPLFETYLEKYQSGYYHLPDEKIDFKIYASAKNTTILFSLDQVVLHVINNPIIFGFNENNHLCYIHIQNMALNDEGFLEKI